MARIQKLLVANRGEIAGRVFRTCRDMGIATVAVCSDPDRRAPFVREADEVVPLGGVTPAESYLRADAIVEAAMRTRADAVHPGYGFLSENAGFVRRCEEAGLVFVGPAAETVEAMGSKLTAKAIMQRVGVPVLPSVDATDLVGDDLLAAARSVGWPVLVKASYGGGGRGMRIVRDPATLAQAVAGARREAASAFGNDTVFLERYVEAPRHVEIQIFGDRHGHVIHLFERECSIQRRYQKVVEEAPSVATGGGVGEEMGAAAVAAGKAIGYVGAGTVEFLLGPDGGFYFLEVNTRLQVEHPVTECVTGLDLVRLQLLVAQGEPLPDDVTAARLAGHAIEVRLYAEDPEHGYRPTTGTLHRFLPPALTGVRLDSGVETGSVVSANYDPMLAKVIVHAPTRAEAAQRLAAALSGMRIHGVTTNRDFLVGVLRAPEFVAGRTDTHFLDRHDPAALARAARGPDIDRQHALAATLALAAGRRASATVLRGLPAGWRNNPSQLQPAVFERPAGTIEVRYRLGRDPVIEVDGEQLSVEVVHASPDAVELTVAGVQRRYEVHVVADVAYVDSPLGSSVLRIVDRLPQPAAHVVPGSLLAPMPGTVVRVAAAIGVAVQTDDPLVVMEAMKMEHVIASSSAGVVADVRVQVGQVVDAGDVLVVVEEESRDA